MRKIKPTTDGRKQPQRHWQKGGVKIYLVPLIAETKAHVRFPPQRHWFYSRHLLVLVRCLSAVKMKSPGHRIVMELVS